MISSLTCKCWTSLKKMPQVV